MGVKYSKMEKVDRLTPETSERIKQMVRRYFSRYGSVYVGITNNPEARFKQHNDRLTRGRGGKFQVEPWPLCVVVCEIASYTRTRRFETELTKLAKDRFGDKAWNDRVGSPGRPPRPGSRGYIYLLLDKRETTFIEVEAADWSKVVKDPERLEALRR